MRSVRVASKATATGRVQEWRALPKKQRAHCAMLLRALNKLSASPHTIMSGCEFRHALIPWRRRGWSSSVRIPILPVARLNHSCRCGAKKSRPRVLPRGPPSKTSGDTSTTFTAQVLVCYTARQQKGLRGFSRSPHAWGLSFNFRYYGHGAGGVGKLYGHGVTGTTAPLLLMASMQFFSISWATRVGFPAVVFPSMHS